MVIKSGRFGKFLACPGYPECSNTKPIVERMPGRCPKCGSTILKLSLIHILFFGRVGIMTISLGFLSARREEERFTYANARVLIG